MRLLGHWIILGIAVCGPAHADGVSGTYVGKGANSAFMVQLVETTGGQLTGRYEQTILKLDGKLEQTIASITGASDGQTVVVTIKTSDVLSASIMASGTIEGSKLHLSGGGNGSHLELNLSKSDEASYRTEVADLLNQGRLINEARIRADQLARLNKLAQDTLAYSTAADAQLEKFPPIEQRYRTITGLMNAALARQRAIYGAGQASVARGQIGVAINQAAIEAEQLHGNLQSAYADIAAKIQPLVKATIEFTPLCQSAEAQQRTDLQAACLQYFVAVKKFKPSMEALERSFNRTEKVWVEEHGKQDGIIRASDIASR